MKKSGLILIVLLMITIIASGCEIKRSEEELRDEIKAELEAEQAAEALAKEEAEKEAELKAEEEKENVFSLIESDKTLVIMTERLNVRRDPVLDSAKVGLITDETTYDYIDEEVREDGYKWYKIIFDGEEEGWIAGWYTLKQSEVSNNIGRAKLINAFDGRLDSKTISIGDNILSYKQAYGPEDMVDGFNGGDVYTYDLTNIFTYGDMGGDIEIGDIHLFAYSEPGQMYGLQIGMTKDEAIAIVGEADNVRLDFSDDYTYMYTNNDLYTYFTGSYSVTLVYSTEGVLERIELYENN